MDAEKFFTSRQGCEPQSHAAAMGLGKIALRKKNWDEAVHFFHQANQQADGTVSAATLLAIALRPAGRVEETHLELQRILARDPLNHPALNEMASGNYPESEAVRQKLQRILADDDQYFIDLACYYMDAGLPEDALKVLTTAWSEKEKAMTAYLCAFLSHQTGDTCAEGTWFDKARGASPDFGFPSRLEEVLALQFALEKDGHDSKAKYFLGNFYYAHERCDEAMQLWTEALEGMDADDVLFRNLGLGEWQRRNNPLAAIEWFEKALATNPHNQDLYLHLDEIYKSQKLNNRREDLLERIKGLAGAREDVHKHRITMMVELGHYQKAIELMETEKFVPLEMDQSFHEVYVQALMMRAKDHLNQGRIEEAIQDYFKMLKYPENHGVGAPTTRAQAHIYYQIGLAYEKLGKYPQAIKAWREAASEHHPHGNELFIHVQRALDKLSRYSELGLEI
jgi:tetratricopeptide (TPR) repeat protein